ncbi:MULTISPECIES: ESX secretion-associated protein EspG [Mycobacteroides]|uniref:Secretion protein n=1 Tax=Mycobacteroides immunogenum TaxID=83262 RepID=A0A179VBN6_9MYCO|nr:MULTISPECIES: ESX secretion-associated protein EspG [Mycobacteroides]OAT69308.1 secretion protein [Mycobacteroides immunogenum]SKT84974.1 putative DNA-binding protein [Mycobacteroides abscessus subsp. massiliense]SKU05671.1 putative DNA-binding protein [Mycobacteroides abscessus subsp. massiliense]
MPEYDAVEVTAQEAWFLADYLQAGEFPRILRITAPYFHPHDAEPFNAQCVAALRDREQPIIDADGAVRPQVANWVRTTCYRTQWLEWLAYASDDPHMILRGVMARTATPFDAVTVLRYAQMVTFTQHQIPYAEAVVPFITAGLPTQVPARFEEFDLSASAGKQLDERIARGADIVDILTELDIPYSSAQVMAMARTGKRMTIELTAHEATNGVYRNTDVSVGIIATEAGLVLASPDPGNSGRTATWMPAEPLAIAVAVRDLTARLPSGGWFPNETLTL